MGAFDKAQQQVEKMLKYRFWDKERERSNHAHLLNDQAQGTRRRCPTNHNTLAWSGPPHDKIRAYVCLHCNAAACEPEIRHYGFEFETVPDWIILQILDADLKRQAEGNAKFFGGFSALGDLLKRK